MAIAESLLAPSRARLCLPNSQARAPRRAAGLPSSPAGGLTPTARRATRLRQDSRSRHP